ncbi:hypothetical protein GE09DRAFT_1110988 [Coniochaeta sp. 2T2.1]|nr:hypothetical protein GE09DRAFT_1110988 [Coniochaeta sp. 2T2.1]
MCMCGRRSTPSFALYTLCVMFYSSSGNGLIREYVLSAGGLQSRYCCCCAVSKFCVLARRRRMSEVRGADACVYHFICMDTGSIFTSLVQGRQRIH